MSTSLKTLTKPQRELLAATEAGKVFIDQDYRGRQIKQQIGPNEWDTRTVNDKTWGALDAAALVEQGDKLSGYRYRYAVRVTETGKRVLAGETVNTARSLVLTFRLGDTQVTRRVPLPNGWHRHPESQPATAARALTAALAEVVTAEWAASDDDAEEPAP